MARTGRPPETADTGEYDAATALAKAKAAELTTAQSTLAELEARLATAALDDPDNFDKLADEVAAAKKGVRRLELASKTAEKRAEAALLEMRRENSRLRINRAFRQLEVRDRIGAEIEAIIQQLGEKYAAMTVATDKARVMFGGLLGGNENRIGLALNAGELESFVAHAYWKASEALPGAQRPIKLTGSPGQYVGADAPSLSAQLREATSFLRSIVDGTRTYEGRVLIEPPAPPPEPKPRSLFGRLLKRKADDVPEETSAPAETTSAAAEPAANGDFNEAVGADNARVADESFEQWLERVTRPEPLTDAEREALHTPPAGETKSADQVMSEVRAQGPYRTVIDHRANPLADW